MKTLPILIQRAELVRAHSRATRDEVVLLDELPVVLDRDGSGHILSRGTRVTEVQRETVDDN